MFCMFLLFFCVSGVFLGELGDFQSFWLVLDGFVVFSGWGGIRVVYIYFEGAFGGFGKCS